MKKCLYFFLLMFLLMSFGLSSAQEETEIVTYTSGIWDYIENETGITLTAYRGIEPDLEIPIELDEKPVTNLQKELFSYHTELISVTIPDSVTWAGNGIFYGCTDLETVRLSRRMKMIPENAFRYCSSLKTVEFTSLITEIGNYAFADCQQIESLDLPSVTKIGNYAFSNCISLKDINLLSVNTINQFAFVNCVQLEELILYSVTTIQNNAFDNCISLRDLTLTQKLSSIGSNAFRDTSWLNTYPEDFLIIGQGILIHYSGNETDVQVPYGVKLIVDAFQDNYQIETVTLPETVIQIGINAFRDAVNLKSIQLSPYITVIGQDAFNGCRSLTEIEIPVTVKSMGTSAFANCNMLQSFTVPSHVTEITSRLFQDDPLLTDVVIPASVTRINGDSFSGTPNVVLHVAYGSAAEEYANEHEIPYSYTVQESADFIYTRDEDGIHIIRYSGNLYDVEIPAQIEGAQVVSIEAGAFQNNDRVHRIIVPLTVKSVGDWAFSYMDKLEAIQFSIGLSKLGSNVFAGTTQLTELKLPNGIGSVGAALIDDDALTMICAAENSKTAEVLTGLGYEIQPETACKEDSEMMALWSELYELETPVTNVPCVCDLEPEPVEDQSYSLLQIPNGISSLAAEMLEEAGDRLILIIPSSVTEIDEEILDSHEIIVIVSDSGSVAEDFARKHDIRFFVEFLSNLTPQ